jgi:23S rRNA (cytosine1962-C5)-methyltransferase
LLSFPEILDGEDKTSPFKNCLRKHYRHLRKWAKRTQTNAFRLYDRDVKGFPVAIDYYDRRFCVQFFASRSVTEPSAKLQRCVEEALHQLFGSEVQAVHWKTRKRQALLEQYEKLDSTHNFFNVQEYGLLFKVNLRDYLDTGLFLDHRETRHIVGEISQGKRLLNLFAYTCAFSVYAAAHGAVFTKSVDLSNTYTEWARQNFLLNGLSLKNHQLVRADCLPFLDQEIAARAKYDLIVIDPPTISRSKKMERKFNIQLDYILLLSKALKLLNAGGVIFFSTNSRTFAFDYSLFSYCSIEEISQKTVPAEYRNKKIHRCWKISDNSL